MSRLLPVPGLVLVLLLCLGLAVPLNPARADEVYRRTLTPLPAGSLAEAPDKVRRGHGMERESLGIAVAAGTGIEARVTNGTDEEVVLSLMTDDHATDVENPTTTRLPADGSWRRITAAADSAVFVRSRDWSTPPVVEYRATGQHWSVPTYALGQDQAAFVDGWRATGSPFAVIDDRAMTMMLPRVDLPRIADMSWSEFEDLDAVIRSYRRIIDTYDGWLGLADGAPAPHTNRFQKPFLRPDATGWGLAYYMGGNYIGTNIDSVHYYLESPSAWLILHEVGHGYDGIMTSPADAGDMHLGEVWNNVYAYLYQSLVMGQTESNWLNRNGKENGQRARDVARHAKGGADFNALSLADRLDVLTRIADLTGTQGLTGFNRGIREWRTSNPRAPWPARTDLIAEHWGQTQGLNLLPWFELHSLEVGGRLAEELLDVDPHPIALPMADFFDDRGRAAQVADRLGLDGPGALVPADRLAALGLNGGLRVQATSGTATGLEGRHATLWLGDREWARAPFRDGTADFGDVPAGAWTLRLPADRLTGAIAERRWVTVAEGETTVVEFAQPEQPQPAGVNGSRFALLGLGDVGFATVTHDRAAGTLTVTDTLAAPHTYFPGQEYARITVRNGGSTLFDRSFVGDRGRQGSQPSSTVTAPVGSTVTITHREFTTRLVETDPFTGAAKPRLDAPAITTTWVVTEHGLARQGQESGALADLVAAVTTDLARLEATVASHPGARLEVAATGLSAAVQQLPAQERSRLLDRYGAALQRLIAPATAEVPPTPQPTPTSKPTAPRPSPTTVRPSTTPTRPAGTVDVYSTPGTHRVGDRTWFTRCEPYSQTTRCRTDIWATTVVAKDGRYVTQTGFAFNNLTYLPQMTREEWTGNPLARTGAWTSADGRRWRTECDTAVTGRGGCRSYAVADVVETIRTPQGTTYRTVRKEIFNNIVRFGR